MPDNSVTTQISGDAQVAGISRNRLLELLRRSDFSGQRKKPELLPLNAADCACSRPLTTSEDEETITINRPGRSTYPEEKSVLTSGATPVPPGSSQLRGLRDIYFPMNIPLQLSTQTRTARLPGGLQHYCDHVTTPIVAHSLRQTLHLSASESHRVSIEISRARPTVRIAFRKHSKHLISAPSGLDRTT